MWRVRRASRLIWPSVVAFGVVVGVWWLLSATGAVPVRDLPSPATVGHKLVHRIATGKFPNEALHSLIRLAFGMAVGLLIDAFIVRAILVPALMTLVGSASAWPGRLLRDEHPQSAGRPLAGAAEQEQV